VKCMKPMARNVASPHWA